MSKVQNISVIAFLSFAIIVGALVFSRGFLLNRQVIPERSGHCSNIPKSVIINADNLDKLGIAEEKVVDKDENRGLESAANWCNPSPPFTKMILILVDALRFDFVQRMEFLSRITTNGSDPSQIMVPDATSCLFKFVADPPTTTMQRLKALMTGTMPTFIDASANFNSYEVEEDSLVYQLGAAGKRLAFLGDDTWLSLFPKKYFKSDFVEAHPSFNAWDLDTVDRAVNKTLREVLLPTNKGKWDVLIAHLLGVDHCGHRYGPDHPEMVRKLNEADAIVEHAFNSMSNDTLLVIFGDHGMTSTGDHGGDSKDETESAVIFLSKQFKKNKQINPPFQCSKQLSISQIDLVPTLASLLGIPIPYSNIGQIIPNFLVNKTYSDAVAANVAQVFKYIQHFSTMMSTSSSIMELYQSAEEAFKEFLSSRNYATRATLHKRCEVLLAQIKSVAVSTWTRFNARMICAGIVITFLAVFAMILYLTVVPKLFNRDTEHSYSVLSWLWPSLTHWSVLCTFFYHSGSSTGIHGIAVSTLCGILVFLSILVFKTVTTILINRRNANYNNQEQKIDSEEEDSQKNFEISEIGSVILYVFTCLVVFSNSFVINEGSVLGATLILVALLRVLLCSKGILEELGLNDEGDLQIPNNEDNLRCLPVVKKLFRCSWSCFFILSTIVRSSSVFFRCREEQVNCNEKFLLHKQLSSLPEDWLVHKYLRYGIALLTLAVFVVSFRHWMIYRRCSFSRKPRALIARFIPSLLVVLLGVFWALQGLPYISSNASKFRLFMNYLPLVYQVVTVTSLLCVWYRPVCCCIGRIRGLSYRNNFSKTTQQNTLTSGSHPGSMFQRGSNLKYGSTLKKSISINGVKKTNGINGTVLPTSINTKGYQFTRNATNMAAIEKPKYSSPLTEEQVREGLIRICYSEDTYSSCLLTFEVLLTLLLVQVTSTGLAPVVILQAYAIICLVGIFKSSSNEDAGSWSAAVAWTLASQYFFYATGHQPIFSAIPWDSAFVGAGDGNNLATASGSWLPWARAGLAVVGNLHVSQIIFSFALPLLVYWKGDNQKLESQMGTKERQTTYFLCGKFIALQGLKLLMCMACAALHRRHLMVWKIFAPKFIFEAVSFIVTSFLVLISMIFVTRIHYFHEQIRLKHTKRSV